MWRCSRSWKRLGVAIVLVAGLSEAGRPLRAEETDCLRCHAETKPWFKRKFKHKPFRDKQCEACHAFHKFEQKLVLKREGQALCLECHADVKATLSGRVHPPVNEGRCWACHDPHSSDSDHLLRQSDAGSPCFACHEDIQFDLYLENPHRPFYDRECVACHSPHASTNEYFLKLRPHVLCSSCHDWAGVREKHLAMFDVPTRCTVCHRPHGSVGAHLIDPEIHPPVLDGCDICHEPVVGGKVPELEVSVAELCANCHDVLESVTHSHPPAEDGECTLCHDPHRSPAPALLKRRGAALCADCHELEPAEEAGSIHRPYADSECARCHNPHGSAFPGLQRAATPDLCFQCHRRLKSRIDSSETVHPPLEAGECASCHRPHVSEAPSLLVGTMKQTCEGCHEVSVEAVSVHRPYAAGVCTGCHDPHAGSGSLLKVPGIALCVGCHEDFADLTDETTAHPPVLDGCVECHSPHQAAHAGLLVRTQRELCEGCHGNPEEDIVDHPTVEGPCVDCHDPHRR